MNGLRLTIHAPEHDFTPLGKRRARVVTHDRGVRRIRWYVSGRRYRALLVTPHNIALTSQWLAAMPPPIGGNRDTPYRRNDSAPGKARAAVRTGE